MYRALVSFSGVISMALNDEREITDKNIVKDLLKAGYIEEVKNTSSKELKKENEGLKAEVDTLKAELENAKATIEELNKVAPSDDEVSEGNSDGEEHDGSSSDDEVQE